MIRYDYEAHPEEFEHLRPSVKALALYAEWYFRTRFERDLTITSIDWHRTTGSHAIGRAFDARSHEFTPEQKAEIVTHFMMELAPIPIFVECHNAGSGEHFHFQLAKGSP